MTNDRFKLRAWDDVAKQMYYGTAEQFDDMLGFRFKHFETDNPIYTQCTGLKDKNDNLIYEGDLLREPAQDEWSKKNYVVQEVFWQDNDCADSHVGWQMNRCYFHGNLVGGSITNTMLPRYTSRMEIIGNKFQNPELLEGK